jgi:amino-acid N-acetyltransferase
MMTIGPATDRDYPGIEALLREHRLPGAGLRSHLDTTLVARDDAAIVGSAGLELYGPSALLRSVAVTGAKRGTGVGRALALAALDLARERGVRDVYLLTETAAAFFARIGFRKTARASVAAPVQQSVEFTTACPASAVCMVLKLTVPA